ncbi:uncharacterized protein [Drosophila takahashii]|uniref:uncharacterized protein n=1 Tax=Drosophila takahashii TaxID=29030 RepID=UPI001CF89178|nr:uncharacterized protein LOC123003348 [Drosophila takahashii]
MRFSFVLILAILGCVLLLGRDASGATAATTEASTASAAASTTTTTASSALTAATTEASASAVPGTTAEPASHTTLSPESKWKRERNRLLARISRLLRKCATRKNRPSEHRTRTKEEKKTKEYRTRKTHRRT